MDEKQLLDHEEKAIITTEFSDKSLNYFIISLLFNCLSLFSVLTQFGDALSMGVFLLLGCIAALIGATVSWKSIKEREPNTLAKWIAIIGNNFISLC